MVTKELKLSEIVEVEVTIGMHTQPDRYLMPKEDVDMFFEATIKLHHSPGVNPVNNNKTTPVHLIVARELTMDDHVYWWASPSLGAETRGARIIKPSSTILKTWSSPEWEAIRAAERAIANREELND